MTTKNHDLQRHLKTTRNPTGPSRQELLDAVHNSEQNCCNLSEDGVWADCDEAVNWKFDENGQLHGICDEGHRQDSRSFMSNLPTFLASDGKFCPCPEIFGHIVA